MNDEQFFKLMTVLERIDHKLDTLTPNRTPEPHWPPNIGPIKRCMICGELGGHSGLGCPNMVPTAAGQP